MARPFRLRERERERERDGERILWTSIDFRGPTLQRSYYFFTVFQNLPSFHDIVTFMHKL